MAQKQNPVEENDLQGIGNDVCSFLDNFDFIADRFDCAEWWEREGKQTYPLIYPVACCILALPDSNGNQERTFSAATWMDGKLLRRQNDLTFQMKVILYKNTKFLELHKIIVEDERRTEAARRAKKLLEKSTELYEDQDIDEDMELLMDSYAELNMK